MRAEEFTEFDQAQSLAKLARDADLRQDGSASAALHQAAQLNAFRVKLADALRPLTDAIEIQAIAARILGESLGATRVIYIEVVANGEEAIVHRNYTNGVAEMSGRFRLEDYRRNLTADHQAGRTQVVTEIPNNPAYTDAEKARYHEIDVAAHVDVPLIKNNQFVALLAVHQSTPRQWTATEVKLVEETAERTWAAVERARAEALLQASHDTFRHLVENSPFGVYVVDADFRIAQVSAGAQKAFENVRPLIGRDFGEAMHILWPESFASEAIARFRHTLETGEPYCAPNLVERRHDVGEVESYDWKIERITLPDGRFGVVCHFYDLSERQRYEAALREGEAQFRNLADSSPVLIWQTDETGITFVNRYYLEFFAQTLDGVRAMGWANFLHPDDAAAYIGACRVAFERQERYEFQCRFLRHDGEYRWLQNVGEPHYGLDHAFVGFIGCSVDVTDIKAAEEISRRTAELDAFRVSLTDALRPLADPVEIQATASRLLGEYLGTNRVAYFEVRGADYVVERDYVNGAAAIVGKYPIASFGAKLLAAYRTGRPVCVFDVTADPNLSPEQQSAYAALQIGAYIGILLIKQGEFVAGLAVHAAKSRAWTAEEVALAEEVAERTWAAVERARTEAALRQSEERYRTLFNSIDEGFCVVEVLVDSDNIPVDYRVLEINPVFEQQTGIQQAVGKTARQLNLEDHWIEVYGQVALTGEAVRFESGSEVLGRWFDVYACRAGVPEARKVAIVFKDISERKRAEAERERLLQREQAARAEAERANRIKDEFLAVLSHELRSPLNPILGWTRLLQNGRLDEARRVEALKTIERNAQLQTQLIEDLLDISRIMQGKLSLTVAPVSLPFVISAAIETVRLAAEAKQVGLQLHLDNTVAPISGDAARLQQVVWNLLTNAVKFTPTGGQVTVELHQLDGLAQIRVIDTGEGINPQFLPHVFEYFRQEDGSTTRRFGGLGLGLAIVRQIVEMHGGTVQAESQGEGQGATFTVQLPTLPQTVSIAPELSHPQTDATLLLAGVQILLVDDEPDTREFQAFVLEQSGARVTAVASGLEALQALERFTPDVLVSDIGMAEMDGYMLLQQIRSRPAHQGGMLPAIALTAYAAEVDRQRALQVGFQTHITKPVEPDVLVRAIVISLGRAYVPG